jgi:hypothetical protein
MLRRPEEVVLLERLIRGRIVRAHVTRTTVVGAQQQLRLNLRAGLVLLACWIATACGPAETASPPIGLSPSPPASTVEWASPPPAACEPGLASPEGHALFGRIADLSGPDRTVTIDLEELFGLPEAVEAARDDGVIGPTEDLPNPFYIRDLHTHKQFGLSETVIVSVIGYDAEGSSTPCLVDITEFAIFWRAGQPATGIWTTSGHYWFRTDGDLVVSIYAQVIP